MRKFKYIILWLLVGIAFHGMASETLTFVKTDGSKVSFSVEGLKITYDDFAHAIVTNDETTATLDLAELDHMYFGDKEALVTGDVNGDGEVNIADVNALIDIILNGQDDSATTAMADVNGDSEVNVADINALIDIILD